jgi:hypothetical protein
VQPKFKFLAALAVATVLVKSEISAIVKTAEEEIAALEKERDDAMTSGASHARVDELTKAIEATKTKAETELAALRAELAAAREISAAAAKERDELKAKLDGSEKALADFDKRVEEAAIKKARDLAASMGVPPERLPRADAGANGTKDDKGAEAGKTGLARVSAAFSDSFKQLAGSRN